MYKPIKTYAMQPEAVERLDMLSIDTKVSRSKILNLAISKITKNDIKVLQKK